MCETLKIVTSPLHPHSTRVFKSSVCVLTVEHSIGWCAPFIFIYFCPATQGYIYVHACCDVCGALTSRNHFVISFRWRVIFSYSSKCELKSIFDITYQYMFYFSLFLWHITEEQCWRSANHLPKEEKGKYAILILTFQNNNKNNNAIDCTKDPLDIFEFGQHGSFSQWVIGTCEWILNAEVERVLFKCRPSCLIR